MAQGEGFDLKGLVDDLVDEEGLKTEVVITLTDETMNKLLATLVTTVLASSVAFFVVKYVYTRIVN